MTNRVKDLAALIVFACVAFVACCADPANAGKVHVYILAGCAMLLAAVLVELEWHGALDRWDKPAADRRRRHYTRRDPGPW